MIFENPTIAIIAIVGFFILLLYTLLILLSGVGISYQPKPHLKNNINSNNIPSISIVVAFKDEAHNLPTLCRSLLNQTYPEEKYEIILVNDHSSDNWQEYLTSLKKKITIVKSQGLGKKIALQTGINIAKGTYIACTDADCIPANTWLQEISQKVNKNASKMILAPVIISTKNKFLDHFQQFDFMAMQLFGLGMAQLNYPILSNGANLIYHREIYMSMKDQLKEKFSSGDDMFLLQTFKKANHKIDVIINPEAIVKTKPELSLSKVLQQRIRWASKSKGYTDALTIFVSFLVLGINLFSCFFFGIAFLYLQFWWLFAMFFTIKSLTDRFLLRKGYKLFETRWSEHRYWIIQLIHPWFISLIAISSFVIPVTWKGRKVKT